MSQRETRPTGAGSPLKRHRKTVVSYDKCAMESLVANEETPEHEETACWPSAQCYRELVHMVSTWIPEIRVNSEGGLCILTTLCSCSDSADLVSDCIGAVRGSNRHRSSCPANY